MIVKNIAKKIERIVPLSLAQDWDNVGLLVGDENKRVKNILLTIDTTKAVVAEAKRNKIDLIISYHPVIWDGLKTVTANDVIYDLIKSQIAVFSIHTALDAATGGVNDGLAEIVTIENGKPLGDYVANPAGDNFKLITFVPKNDLAKVSNAIFAAGAGTIGNYSNCSFATPGMGTFKPLAGSKPAIGKKGKLEKVLEIRLESIVPGEKLNAVLAAMKKAHPYETPAYDVVQLFDDRSKFGLGRIGKLKKPLKLATIIERIKKQTGAKAIGIVGPKKRAVKTAAVCAGSCGKVINSVLSADCDLYLTGELKHHQALAAQEAGLTCLCLSHTVSERFILKTFAKRLRGLLNNVNIKISKKDKDPFMWHPLG